MTIKGLKELIANVPDDSEVRIISQSFSFKNGCIIDAELESIGWDENNNITYFEVGEFNNE
jgi:hypothetical protein